MMYEDTRARSGLVPIRLYKHPTTAEQMEVQADGYEANWKLSICNPDLKGLFRVVGVSDLF